MGSKGNTNSLKSNSQSFKRKSQLKGFEALNEMTHQERQSGLNFLLKAPANHTLAYLDYCRNHYTPAALDNLHFLFSNPAFVHKEETLGVLREIKSSASLEFLYQYSSHAGLHLRKKILEAIKDFPQNRIHPVLFDTLRRNEPELKLLCLDILGEIEKIEEL